MPQMCARCESCAQSRDSARSTVADVLNVSAKIVVSREEHATHYWPQMNAIRYCWVRHYRGT